jgi:hypothetical protein
MAVANYALLTGEGGEMANPMTHKTTMVVAAALLHLMIKLLNLMTNV